MNDDLISRSALLEELSKGTIITDDLYGMGIMAGNENAMKKINEAPAVDAEAVFDAAGLVKDAFDMAKSSLVSVVRCGQCIHRADPKRISCKGRSKDWFCADGKRESSDGKI